MRRTNNVHGALLAMLAVSTTADAQYELPPSDLDTGGADLVLSNARIYTPGAWSSALAVSGNVIIALGDEDAVKPHIDDDTRVIDLDGATVLPGLHDMHVHPALAGFEEMSCKITHGAGLEIGRAHV